MMRPDLTGLSDGDLLRLLAAAEAEVRTRRLVPDEKMTRPDRPRQVIGREET